MNCVRWMNAGWGGMWKGEGERLRWGERLEKKENEM
jgi:hypothetical protein